LSALTARSARILRLAQRRAGPADRGVEVVGVARHAGAQRADDEAQALAIGAAQDVVDEVGRHGRRRPADGDDGARLELLLGRAGQAVDEVLADQRLRARLAEHVAAQRAEAVLVDLEADQRVLGALVELDGGDLARAHAGDLEIAALDEAEGVVELDPVHPLVGIRARAGQRDPAGAEARDDEQGDQRAPHGPSGSSEASHGKSSVGL
jgi:hypothetical protein